MWWLLLGFSNIKTKNILYPKIKDVPGTPEGTRTPDLLVRSQSLYPTELPAHTTLNALKYNSTGA